MKSTVHRRAFIAATTIAIPSIAIAGVLPRQGSMEQMDFHDLMKQIGKSYKAMRAPMRSLETEDQWETASFYANEMTILLAQAIAAAEQVDIASQSKSDYDGDKVAYTNNLRIVLADTAITTLTVSKALWSKEKEAAKSAYAKLRIFRADGHAEFQEDE
jgi:hypothetical protein